jgi:hypothetical protein
MAFEWIVGAVSRSGKPSIVNLSLTLKHDEALNRGVSAAIAAGIHFVGAAGNMHKDASLRFPGGSECSCLEKVKFQGLTLHSVQWLNLVGAVNYRNRMYILHPPSDRILIHSLGQASPITALMWMCSLWV